MDDTEYFAKLLGRSCSPGNVENNIEQTERTRTGEKSRDSVLEPSEITRSEKSADTATKRKRNTLSIEKKVEILEKLHDGVSVSELQKEYDVGQTTIYDLKKHRQKILTFYVECESDETLSKRRMRGPQNIELENHLYEWYCQCVHEEVAVSGPMLIGKAKALHAELDIEKDCNYSKGWLERFRKRHSIRLTQGGDYSSMVLRDRKCIPRKNVERLFNADNYKKSSVSRSAEEMKPFFGAKRKRNALSIQQKVEVLKKLDDGVSVSVLAKEYDIGNSTIYELKANKFRILKFYSESDSVLGMAKRKTLHESQNPNLDRALYDWYRRCRGEGTVVSRHMLIRKVKELHKEMDIKSDRDYSTSWIHNFESRHGICHLAPTRETRLNKFENYESFSDLNSFDVIMPDDASDTDVELLKIIKEAISCITHAWGSLRSPILKEAWNDMLSTGISSDGVGDVKPEQGLPDLESGGFQNSPMYIDRAASDIMNAAASIRTLPKDNRKKKKSERQEILTIEEAISTVSRLVNFLEQKSLLTQEEIVQMYQIKNKLIKAKPKCARKRPSLPSHALD